jgi:hypothetical protein
MKQFLITKAVGLLVSMIDEDIVRRGLDAMFDKIEEEVKRSENQIDDALVLPVIRTIRAATNTQ